MKASRQKPTSRPPTRQDAVATVTKTAQLGKHASAGTARACSGFSDLYQASPADRVALRRYARLVAHQNSYPQSNT
ncbi:MAG: hypothetical protein IPL70_15630 [Uliginosibacterium sp.]|nr:hypothetical protein [Uliginosibacterium sp.]